MSAPRNVEEALDELASRPLPFDCYEMGLDEGRIVLHVAIAAVEWAVDHLDHHPVILSDGTTVAVEVVGQAGGGWISEPTRSPAGQPDAMQLEELIGLDVRETGRRANEAGWHVRAYEPEAWLTADHRTDRLNLCYSATGIVTHAGIF